MGALQKLMARGGGGAGMPKSLGGPGAPPPQMSAPAAPGPPMVPPVLRAVVDEVFSLNIVILPR